MGNTLNTYPKYEVHYMNYIVHNTKYIVHYTKYIVHYTKRVVLVKNLTVIIARIKNGFQIFEKTFSMLQFKLKEVMLAAGIPNPYTWLIKFGKFSQPKATGLLKQSAKTITLKDISKLCMLLNCTPNDLLYWAVDKR